MKILPFKGYRYNLAKTGRLDDVISPPYDQFKEGLDDLLYRKHPNNIARIIMNKETPQDTPADNRYTRSKGLLDQWIREGVFLQDKQPCLYPYFQDYALKTRGTLTRKGFIALGEVTDYAQKVVFPHERTLSKPKQDRLNLLRSTLADTGLVFMLYSDPSGKIEALLDAATCCPAEMQALDLNHEMNRLWKVEDSHFIDSVCQAMLDKTVIIADGHHRYEVALNFKQEAATKASHDKNWALYGYKLMSFVRLESAGITIFPIHRLIHSVASFDATALLKRLSDYFKLEDFPFDSGNKLTLAGDLLEASEKLQRAGQNAFVLYLPSLGRYVLMTFLKESGKRVSWPEDKTAAWQRLDISVLQVVVLNNLLGIGDRQLADQTNLEYVSDFKDAIQMTDAKGYQCAVLLNPTPVEHVKEVVEAGDILPQKSTHFHPKLMEGLVFAKHV